jgi:nucleotide-binding universal stress UspA family protein
MFSKVLLAVDCWPESQAAIDATKDIASLWHAEVVVLHVRERQPGRATVWEPGLPGDVEELVEKTVYELAGIGVSARAELRSAIASRVPEQIVEVAREQRADLIVVGTQRLSCLRGFVSGSVCHRLIKLADRPLLIA